VQQEAAAVAQKQQLDIQQEQANIERTKLSNLVSETNFKSGEESKVKLQQLVQTPEGKAALLSDDRTALLKLIAPIQAASGDTENYSNTIKSISAVEMQQANADLKKQDDNARTIGTALVTIRNASTEKTKAETDDTTWTGKSQFEQNMDALPKATKDAITKASPNFLQLKAPILQKSILEHLHMTASNQNNAATNATRIALAEIQDRWHERNNETQVQIAELRRNTGAGGTSKADAREDRQYNQSRRDASRIDGAFKKPIAEAKAAYEKAVTIDRIKSWAGMGSSPEENATTPEQRAKLPSTIAWNAYQALKKDRVQEKMDALEGMPEGKEKNKIFDGLTKEFNSYDTEAPIGKEGGSPTPTAAKADSAKPASAPKSMLDVGPTAAKPSATSNKSDSKFVEGKVYTDSKGNKAKYVNGKWVPQ